MILNHTAKKTYAKPKAKHLDSWIIIICKSVDVDLIAILHLIKIRKYEIAIKWLSMSLSLWITEIELEWLKLTESESEWECYTDTDSHTAKQNEYEYPNKLQN